MDAKTNVTIRFYNLPEQPNHHKLTVALEERINQAVLSALSDSIETGSRGVEIEVEVPELR